MAPLLIGGVAEVDGTLVVLLDDLTPKALEVEPARAVEGGTSEVNERANSTSNGVIAHW